MIKVSIFYPYRKHGHFDVDYYCNTHMSLAARCLGAALRGWSVDVGINAGMPDSPPPFAVAGHLLFDSLETFQTAFALASEDLLADIPNFTDGGRGTFLVSEIKVSA
jgi:uncharacterized protein (TIGR02118 family)